MTILVLEGIFFLFLLLLLLGFFCALTRLGEADVGPNIFGGSPSKDLLKGGMFGGSPSRDFLVWRRIGGGPS